VTSTASLGTFARCAASSKSLFVLRCSAINSLMSGFVPKIAKGISTHKTAMMNPSTQRAMAIQPLNVVSVPTP
jgi:hypothetical protein